APFGSGVGRWTRDREPAVRARAPRDLSGRRARCAARARISVRLARPAAARSAVPLSRPRVGAPAAVRTGRRYGATLSAAPRMPALSRSGRAMSRQPPVAVIDNDCFTWRYAMANDAMIIAVDRIRFLWPRAKKMTLYAVGIAGDNRGKVLVTEPPSLTTIKHVPRAARPAVWEFGGDGYPIYQRTGGLPDIVVAHLLIVRSRSRTRRAGEIVSAVAKS